MRKGGFEPPRLSAPPPQDGVSASSTTSAGCNCNALNILARSAFRGQPRLHRILQRPFAFYTGLRVRQVSQPREPSLHRILAWMSVRMLVSMVSCPATYCKVTGSVCLPASVRNVCRSGCNRPTGTYELGFNLRDDELRIYEELVSRLVRRRKRARPSSILPNRYSPDQYLLKPI